MHPLIRFLLRSRVDEKCADLHKPFISYLFLVGTLHLEVYVAAIAAHHDAVDGRSLGKHDLIVRFLKGARRMNPSRPPLVPSWDLSIVLAGLQRGPFEPLDSVELKFLSAKTALLTALTSIKKVGDLQAFSVSEECLVFGPVYSHVVLRPRPGNVPKVPTTPFCDPVVNLQALPSEEADPALALLCPVRALHIYMHAIHLNCRHVWTNTDILKMNVNVIDFFSNIIHLE